MSPSTIYKGCATFAYAIKANHRNAARGEGKGRRAGIMQQTGCSLCLECEIENYYKLLGIDNSRSLPTGSNIYICSLYIIKYMIYIKRFPIS